MALITQLVRDLTTTKDPTPDGTRLLGKDLRKKFNTAPDTVLSAYGLTDDAAAALFSMDRYEIINYIDSVEVNSPLGPDAPLLRLVGDLIGEHDPDPLNSTRLLGNALRGYAVNNVKLVLDAYHLKGDDRKAAKLLIESQFQKADDAWSQMEAEMDDWEFPVGEFPADPGPDCHGLAIEVQYPDPQPLIVSAQQVAQLLLIVGQGFIKGRTFLSINGSAPTMLDVSAGTFRCGTCAIPRDKFTLSAGNYPFAVTVAAPGTAAKSYTIPNRGILITLK